MGKRDEAEREVGNWVERLARLGYFVKGVVYVTVGALAVQAAIGTGGRTTGASGALFSIAQQPFGQWMLGTVAVGLFGHALWRLIQALLDVENKGRSPKALLKRFGYLASGFAYGSLAIEASRLVLGIGADMNDQTYELWTARILAMPIGRWLVAAGAIVLFALAVNTAVVAVRRMYRDKLQLDEMSEGEERAADIAAIAGLLGRGVVFAVVGFFLVRAALYFNAESAGDSAEALDAIARAPFGFWLLGAVAVGLVAYGVFAMVQAQYREMDL